jgi:hypothetical protein
VFELLDSLKLVAKEKRFNAEHVDEDCLEQFLCAHGLPSSCEFDLACLAGVDVKQSQEESLAHDLRQR